MVDAILTQTLLPEISREFLNRMLEGKPVQQVRVSVREGAFAYDFESRSETAAPMATVI